ncbi:MAG: type II toxin-antitoxin system RelE/ParE family toxin [Acidobacteriota bacterium]
MRIVWSPLAIQRVREAAEYIARDKPGAAQRWIRGAFETVGRLAKLPHSGRVVPELGRPDIREVIYGFYRIIYRVTPRTGEPQAVRPGMDRVSDRRPDDCLLSPR